MEPVESALSSDNVFTAARRVIRNIRVDDGAHGGLLSIKTIEANELLSRHIDAIEKQIKSLHPTGDRVRITITKEPDIVPTTQPTPMPEM